MRDDFVKAFTEKIDTKLASVANKGVIEMPIKEMQELIAWTRPDQDESEHVWNPVAVANPLGNSPSCISRPPASFLSTEIVD